LSLGLNYELNNSILRKAVMEQIRILFHKPTEVLFMTHVFVFLIVEFCKKVT